MELPDIDPRHAGGIGVGTARGSALTGDVDSTIAEVVGFHEAVPSSR